MTTDSQSQSRENQGVSSSNKPQASAFRSFADFWPFYVREHSDPRNRRLHFVGTLLTFGFLAAALATGEWLWALGMPLMGYGFAWFGHFIVEKNRPATFKHPIWSLIGDYKMFFLMLSGRMDLEVQKARAFMDERRP